MTENDDGKTKTAVVSPAMRRLLGKKKKKGKKEPSPAEKAAEVKKAGEAGKDKIDAPKGEPTPQTEKGGPVSSDGGIDTSDPKVLEAAADEFSGFEDSLVRHVNEGGAEAPVEPAPVKPEPETTRDGKDNRVEDDLFGDLKPEKPVEDELDAPDDGLAALEDGNPHERETITDFRVDPELLAAAEREDTKANTAVERAGVIPAEPSEGSEVSHSQDPGLRDTNGDVADITKDPTSPEFIIKTALDAADALDAKNIEALRRASEEGSAVQSKVKRLCLSSLHELEHGDLSAKPEVPTEEPPPMPEAAGVGENTSPAADRDPAAEMNGGVKPAAAELRPLVEEGGAKEVTQSVQRGVIGRETTLSNEQLKQVITESDVEAAEEAYRIIRDRKILFPMLGEKLISALGDMGVDINGVKILLSDLNYGPVNGEGIQAFRKLCEAMNIARRNGTPTHAAEPEHAKVHDVRSEHAVALRDTVISTETDERQKIAAIGSLIKMDARDALIAIASVGDEASVKFLADSIHTKDVFAVVSIIAGFRFGAPEDKMNACTRMEKLLSEGMAVTDEGVVEVDLSETDTKQLLATLGVSLVYESELSGNELFNFRIRIIAMLYKFGDVDSLVYTRELREKLNKLSKTKQVKQLLKALEKTESVIKFESLSEENRTEINRIEKRAGSWRIKMLGAGTLGLGVVGAGVALVNPITMAAGGVAVVTALISDFATQSMAKSMVSKLSNGGRS